MDVETCQDGVSAHAYIALATVSCARGIGLLGFRTGCECSDHSLHCMDKRNMACQSVSDVRLLRSITVAVFAYDNLEGGSIGWIPGEIQSLYAGLKTTCCFSMQCPECGRSREKLDVFLRRPRKGLDGLSFS